MYRGVWILAAALAPLMAQPYQPLTNAERAKWFVRNTYNPPSLLLASPAIAGWRTYRQNPVEWDKSPVGFGQRYGSHLLNTTITNGTEAAMGAVLHEDPRYFPLTTGTTGQRLRQVLKQTVLSRHSNGQFRFGTARALGFTASAVARHAYMPDSVTTAGHTAARVGIGYSGRFFGNFFREFRPEIRALFKRN